jgi:hypothetical protein
MLLIIINDQKINSKFEINGKGKTSELKKIAGVSKKFLIC